MRLLADANVLLDYLLRRPGYGEDIRDLFVMGFYGDAELWAPAKSLTDVFCVARKAIGSAAEKVRANYIVTRDKAGFARAGVPAMTPRELLEEVSSKTGHHYAEVTW